MSINAGEDPTLYERGSTQTLGAMLNAVAVGAIEAYRSYVSPLKGFRCAYGVTYGNGSCSDIALRIVRRFGAVRLLRLMPLQAARCRRALLLSQSNDPEREFLKHEERNPKLSNRCFSDSAHTCVSCCPWP